MDKIFRLKTGVLFGAAGDAGFIALVLEWLEGGARKKRPKAPDGGGLEGIVINPDGTACLLDNYLCLIKCRSKLVALGSGGDKARAFMEAGMSAAEAIKVIVDRQLDVYTGGEVQTLQLVPKKIRGGRHRRVPRKP